MEYLGHERWWLPGQFTLRTGLSHKLIKHQHYATGNASYFQGDKRFVPAKFYFAVPPELAEYAKLAATGLPYGVWTTNQVIKPERS